jgi:SAM-dependent methyltransferase
VPAAAPSRPRNWPQEGPGELLAFFEGAEHRLIHKWMHYFEIYERHLAKFKGRDISLLEFGVSHGGSLQMWKHYFGPAARIFGADVDPRCLGLEEDRIRIFLADQGDPARLEQLKAELPPLDIVIDDGGHHMNQQICTLEAMFDQLKDGGIYLAEDLHTSYWPEFGGGYRREGSFIEVAKGLVDKLNAWHVRDGAEPVAEFSRWAYGLHFYDSVLVIEKRAMVRPEGRMTGTASW